MHPDSARRTPSGETVLLAGFDFGSTTCSAMAAHARLDLNCVTGRVEFGQPDIFYRSAPRFTPFQDDSRLDLNTVSNLLNLWLTEGNIDPTILFSGGAIVTGLAAERDNARALTELVERRIGNMVMATVRDPVLESWLAFMGSCADLVRPGESPVLNLDIGGGTTNAALGVEGQVIAAGCHFIGARHLQFAPDGETLSGFSEFGQTLLSHLDLSHSPGERMEPDAIARVIAWYVQALEAIAQGQREIFRESCGRMHEQVPFTPALPSPPRLTFSGGVGEMIYAALDGTPLPPRSLYGDLGTDLARAIMASPLLSRDLRTTVPRNRGRATVCGLTVHGTDISGSTVFLSPQSRLPLRDLPVLACVDFETTSRRLADVFAMIGRHPAGGCLRLDTTTPPTLAELQDFGRRLADVFTTSALPPELPVVILTNRNIGRTLGNYATRWRTLPVNLIVLDEVPGRDARFVRVGRPRNTVLPVSFYDMNHPLG
ncbi:reactivating factor for ethanolamine ammonia lyase [Acetobacter estunensis]|uniref:Reactivating factor for ethanolamine ammonia lyase n=1 Tax=Acetobacter estunensis TaxID=104097 RepID=A0A967ECM5_9PROT|nr:ethanolamine ammonia-lyase reactivating factor EutA [Acetobacter estunensis]NHO54788.1 reactivating factor for ethanolamine ammonia lyase [Acetobacter estunensis]